MCAVSRPLCRRNFSLQCAIMAALGPTFVEVLSFCSVVSIILSTFLHRVAPLPIKLTRMRQHLVSIKYMIRSYGSTAIICVFDKIRISLTLYVGLPALRIMPVRLRTQVSTYVINYVCGSLRFRSSHRVSGTQRCRLVHPLTLASQQLDRQCSSVRLASCIFLSCRF